MVSRYDKPRIKFQVLELFFNKWLSFENVIIYGKCDLTIH